MTEAHKGLLTMALGMVGLVVLVGWRPVAIGVALGFIVVGTIEMIYGEVEASRHRRDAGRGDGDRDERSE